MFMLGRRFAGALLVFGFVYFFVHPLWDPRSIFSSPTENNEGLCLFVGWLLTFGMIGTALLCGRSAPWWFYGISICMFVFMCLALFGDLPSFLGHIHDERSFWLAYIFNIVPIVQGLSWPILGKHHELDQWAVPQMT